MDLFDQPAPASAASPGPLADRMRPRTLAEMVGQGHLIGPGKVLRQSLEAGRLHSMILWGPPGTGKTTLALLMAQVAGARFVTFSAVLAGVKEIRQVMAEADCGFTKTFPPPTSTTSSEGGASRTRSMVYSMPAQPPFFTPMRMPAAGLSALARISRTRSAARSVTETTWKRGRGMSVR